MILSEISVRRPVFAMVVSLLLTIIGLMALSRLTVRETPNVQPPVVSIDTVYRGASAAVIESKITQLIENQIAGLEGVETLRSSSFDERSRITIEFALDRDIEAAANDVRDRVARVVQQLPDEAEQPQIAKVDTSSEAVMWLALTSATRTQLELTDYADRYLVDRLSVVPGVANIFIGGQRRYAMRVWLDRKSLAARQLTVQDVEDSLRQENIELPAGRIESLEREFTLRTDTGFRTPDDFRQLVVGRGGDGYLVRLGEVASVEVAAEDLRSIARTDGNAGVSLGIVPQSTANVLDVSKGVYAEMAEVQKTLPKDLTLDISIDDSVFVSKSIYEVEHALVVALLLVLVVIYLFLGTVRATVIPAVTIPVSIISACIVMAIAGFSVNVLTLLGAVLAIGLVVDDAIVVLENIVRRMELGEAPLLASVDGSREIGFAVIATTLVLMAVFLPISFIPGNVGRLFGEFGITIAAAIGISALVSLTLVPMMCSKIFANGIVRGRVAHAVDRFFQWLSNMYERSLRRALAAPLLVVVAGALAFGLALVLFKDLPSEYTPSEDRQRVFIRVTAPEGSSLQYLDRYLRQVEEVVAEEVERGNVRRYNSRAPSFGGGSDMNTGFVSLNLSEWDERKESAQEIAARMRQRLSNLVGVRVNVGMPGGLGIRGSGIPVQVVLGGSDYAELAKWRDIILAKAAENPGLTNLDSDFYARKPQIRVMVDRNRAGDLGVSLTAVGRTLETMMGSRIVTTYLDRGEEYNVVLQAKDTDRATTSDLTNIYVRSATTRQLVPLSNLVTIEETAGPTELKRFNRLRSITLSANLTPGYSLGEALDYMENLIRTELPAHAVINYDGESREFKRSGDALYVTFMLALLIVFLVLAAQFESFRHPLIIMMTVPLAVAGALSGLWLTDRSINVYSQIGCIMLIGLAAKNGILIVEFANQLRDRGVEFYESIIESSAIRLRPVLMTSLCTVFGAVPLLVASGAGSESRSTIGSVIVYGVTFSLLLTLYVVPVIYAFVARNTKSPEYISHMIDKLRTTAGTKPIAAPKEQTDGT
ncbi:multidrug transporter [Steroidobacter agaridevorans]|uniref:Multidrug transporter n=1 Tax=Steroidobacter agaridevorans TaxID=2695856 RepID=A0A829Y7S4_9GAMM|nr:efflux RND transporter permease subunit [Steroidobacter agaridevorans]GFE79015.1 multidrug transporter [Steroidobacter agaridevorans]GFE88170.1 multidrug transporter [Steroidobacter agaridevorans]